MDKSFIIAGPVVMKNEDGSYEIKAAGPTTSAREEPYQGDIMKKFGVRAVIGKGGMGPKTLAALEEHGGVYLNAIGGAAQYYADCIKAVEELIFFNFGIPEATWHLRVKDFTAVVTIGLGTAVACMPMSTKSSLKNCSVGRQSIKELS